MNAQTARQLHAAFVARRDAQEAAARATRHAECAMSAAATAETALRDGNFALVAAAAARADRHAEQASQAAADAGVVDADLGDAAQLDADAAQEAAATAAAAEFAARRLVADKNAADAWSECSAAYAAYEAAPRETAETARLAWVAACAKWDAAAPGWSDVDSLDAGVDQGYRDLL